jgi:SH3 domain-containing YSC84-like protein 1
MKMLKTMGLAMALTAVAALQPAVAQEKQDEKIQKSVEVIRDFSGMKESIPSQLIQQAEGIVIIPNLINAGLGIGGKRGKGVAMVKNADGSWSDPVFVTLTGGSIGFQAGVQSVDLVMVFRHKSSLTEIGKADFTLGGDASVAAGPVGRSGSANTNYKLDAEVYSYSRSKGLFAGISLNGARLSVDADANKNFYGSSTTAARVFTKGTPSSESSVSTLKSAVNDLN